MPRGGRRTGSTGAAYKQRSDLNPAHKLPKTAAPGQAYGEAGQQLAAQSAVPMASGPAVPPQPGPPQGQPPPALPTVVPMGAPSLRPGEPVTAPPIPPQAPNGPDPLLNGVALLNSLGDSASPEVKALRNVVSAQQANAAAP